jgi:hypothetical protein
MSQTIDSRPSRTAPVARVVAAIVGLSAAAPGGAQQASLGGQTVTEIDRLGAARVLETAGPPLFGRREFYRPVPPLALGNRWILVQDSTFGVVFTQPSGVKPDLDGYEADLYLGALEDVRAIEVRALAFNVWGEPAGYLGMTVLMDRYAGDRWDLHPRWQGDGLAAHEHRTTITWVNRVMFGDESILEASVEPIAVAWAHVTGYEFEGLPEDSLRRATVP